MLAYIISTCIWLLIISSFYYFMVAIDEFKKNRINSYNSKDYEDKDTTNVLPAIVTIYENIKDTIPSKPVKKDNTIKTKTIKKSTKKVSIQKMVNKKIGKRKHIK